MVKFCISCWKHSRQLIHKPTTSIINEQCTCFVVSQERMHKTALITGLLDEVFSATPSLMEEIASSHRHEDNTSHVAIETSKKNCQSCFNWPQCTCVSLCMSLEGCKTFSRNTTEPFFQAMRLSDYGYSILHSRNYKGMGTGYRRNYFSGIVWVVECFLRLVNSCLHWLTITNACWPKGSQKSLHPNLVPILPIIYCWFSVSRHSK